jgi:hypothetical protein
VECQTQGRREDGILEIYNTFLHFREFETKHQVSGYRERRVAWKATACSRQRPVEILKYRALDL